MQGGKSSEAATGDKSPFLPVQQDRTFNKPSPLWKRVGAPVGSTEAEVAPAAALATAAAAAAAPALLGETVPLRQGRTRLELKEAPSRRRRRALPGCSVKALRQKKNQQFIERRSYSLSGYPTPTGRRIYSRLSLGGGGAQCWWNCRFTGKEPSLSFFVCGFCVCVFYNKLHNGSTFRQCIFSRAYWELHFWKALQDWGISDCESPGTVPLQHRSNLSPHLRVCNACLSPPPPPPPPHYKSRGGGFQVS